ELAFDDPDGDPLGNELVFYNNTIVGSPNYNFSIIDPTEATDTCFIVNNIFCEPGFSGGSYSFFDPYLNITDTTFFKFSNNQFNIATGDQYFKDAINDDYRLTHQSPAINVGSDAYFEYDILGNPRNLAGQSDAGAYEYVPEC